MDRYANRADADRASRGGCRTVPAVAHPLVSRQRLIDVVEPIELDSVQVMFHRRPGRFYQRVDKCLQRIGALVVPWAQARRQPGSVLRAGWPTEPRRTSCEGGARGRADHR
jgi:hypothetical protein